MYPGDFVSTRRNPGGAGQMRHKLSQVKKVAKKMPKTANRRSTAR